MLDTIISAVFSLLDKLKSALHIMFLIAVGVGLLFGIPLLASLLGASEKISLAIFQFLIYFLLFSWIWVPILMIFILAFSDDKWEALSKRTRKIHAKFAEDIDRLKQKKIETRRKIYPAFCHKWKQRENKYKTSFDLIQGALELDLPDIALELFSANPWSTADKYVEIASRDWLKQAVNVNLQSERYPSWPVIEKIDDPVWLSEYINQLIDENPEDNLPSRIEWINNLLGNKPEIQIDSVLHDRVRSLSTRFLPLDSELVTQLNEHFNLANSEEIDRSENHLSYLNVEKYLRRVYEADVQFIWNRNPIKMAIDTAKVVRTGLPELNEAELNLFLDRLLDQAMASDSEHRSELVIFFLKKRENDFGDPLDRHLLDCLIEISNTDLDIVVSLIKTYHRGLIDNSTALSLCEMALSSAHRPVGFITLYEAVSEDEQLQGFVCTRMLEVAHKQNYPGFGELGNFVIHNLGYVDLLNEAKNVVRQHVESGGVLRIDVSATFVSEWICRASISLEVDPEYSYEEDSNWFTGHCVRRFGYELRAHLGSAKTANEFKQLSNTTASIDSSFFTKQCSPPEEADGEICLGFETQFSDWSEEYYLRDGVRVPDSEYEYGTFEELDDDSNVDNEWSSYDETAEVSPDIGYWGPLNKEDPLQFSLYLVLEDGNTSEALLFHYEEREQLIALLDEFVL